MKNTVYRAYEQAYLDLIKEDTCTGHYPDYPWRTTAPKCTAGIAVSPDTEGPYKLHMDKVVKWLQEYIIPMNQMQSKIDAAIPVYHPDIQEYSGDVFITKYQNNNGTLTPVGKEHYSVFFPWKTTVPVNINEWMQLPEEKKYVFKEDQFMTVNDIKPGDIDESELFYNHPAK